ncbi:MAG TPA: hypothetical protein VK879_04210 [Candidatus Sulfomarinibacteraceae bacterium]|nr:hypothetical protein [Candidatus Sulfomarinibacteraceae bacterium]
MESIGVECIVEEDGSVRVRRIRRNNVWEGVEQGRQWQDEEGRHVLLMLRGTTVREAVLSSDDLRWRLKESRGPRRQIV